MAKKRKKATVTVLYQVDRSTKTDRFAGREVSCQMFKHGKALVRVDNVDVLYRDAQKIVHRRPKKK